MKLNKLLISVVLISILINSLFAYQAYGGDKTYKEELTEYYEKKMEKPFFLLIALGGLKGAKTIITLGITGMIIIFVYIPY
ncbi:MAG: hypothetical protein AB1420_11830 [Bacillota bacterium]